MVRVSLTGHKWKHYPNFASVNLCLSSLYPPPKQSFKGGILFSRCPSVRASVRNVLFLYYLEDPLMEFHETLQASVYLWGKYVHAKIKG